MKKTNLNGQILSEKEMKEVKGGYPNIKPYGEKFEKFCPECYADYAIHGYYETDDITGLHMMLCLNCGCKISEE